MLAEGLPVGTWREKLGLNGACQLCIQQDRETAEHAFLECEEVRQVWDLFRNTKAKTNLTSAYLSWPEISRGLMTTPSGPNVEAELRWDTAAEFALKLETPWVLLRAQTLWPVWCQRLAHKFNDETFHLGLVLWYAWRNTVYAAMEAFKELHRHKRNEERRQEQIACFRQVWTNVNLFGRADGEDIRWHLTPPQEFLPQELGAWTVPPIRIHRTSPSPDVEVGFVAQQRFPDMVDDFLTEITNNFPIPQQDSQHEQTHGDAPTPHRYIQTSLTQATQRNG